jgi:hypothetical protein
MYILVLMDEYIVVENIMDELLVESDIGFAGVYESNRISIVLNYV